MTVPAVVQTSDQFPPVAKSSQLSPPSKLSSAKSPTECRFTWHAVTFPEERFYLLRGHESHPHSRTHQYCPHGPWDKSRRRLRSIKNFSHGQRLRELITVIPNQDTSAGSQDYTSNLDLELLILLGAFKLALFRLCLRSFHA